MQITNIPQFTRCHLPKGEELTRRGLLELIDEEKVQRDDRLETQNGRIAIAAAIALGSLWAAIASYTLYRSILNPNLITPRRLVATIVASAISLYISPIVGFVSWWSSSKLLEHARVSYKEDHLQLQQSIEGADGALSKQELSAAMQTFDSKAQLFERMSRAQQARLDPQARKVALLDDNIDSLSAYPWQLINSIGPQLTESVLRERFSDARFVAIARVHPALITAALAQLKGMQIQEDGPLAAALAKLFADAMGRQQLSTAELGLGQVAASEEQLLLRVEEQELSVDLKLARTLPQLEALISQHTLESGLDISGYSASSVKILLDNIREPGLGLPEGVRDVDFDELVFLIASWTQPGDLRLHALLSDLDALYLERMKRREDLEGQVNIAERQGRHEDAGATRELLEQTPPNSPLSLLLKAGLCRSARYVLNAELRSPDSLPSSRLLRVLENSGAHAWAWSLLLKRYPKPSIADLEMLALDASVVAKQFRYQHIEQAARQVSIAELKMMDWPSASATQREIWKFAVCDLDWQQVMSIWPTPQSMPRELAESYRDHHRAAPH